MAKHTYFEYEEYEEYEEWRKYRSFTVKGDSVIRLPG
jgi:hypothetical protein